MTEFSVTRLEMDCHIVPGDLLSMPRRDVLSSEEFNNKKQKGFEPTWFEYHSLLLVIAVDHHWHSIVLTSEGIFSVAHALQLDLVQLKPPL